jgi:Protein of unknown function (DUF3300)
MSTWSNCNRRFCFIAALVAPIALSDILPASAQGPQDQQQSQPPQPQPQQEPPQQPQQQPQQQRLTQQQVQQLVAPIALYPDALLAQILTASTYPLEVTMAARWSEKNQNLKGPALEEAMQKEPWDTSVKGLTSVPEVLVLMNEKLDWTSQLGEAFLAQPDDVQNAIQALRRQAQSAGNLKSSKEQKVSKVPAPASSAYAGPPEYIVIEPVEPDYVYVPVYDPVLVYGPGYWGPGYAPFFWHPPWWTVGPVFGFGAALFVGPALWYQYNWGRPGFAAIQTNTALYSRFNRVSTNVAGGGQWKFNPAHRGNVQFRNTNLQQQFGNVGGKGVQGIQSGKAIQGIQSGTGLQGVQTGKGVQGIQTGKNIQGVQTGNKKIQGVQTSKTIQTSKSVQTGQGGNRVRTTSRTVTNRTIQSGQIKGGQNVQAKRVQAAGNKGKGKGQH